MADLSKIPLVALSIDTKILVSTLLNPTKWLLTDDGIPRDWRGLAQLWEMGGETIPSLASHSNPTDQLFTIEQNKTPSRTVKDLELMLAKMDRWDVIDDAQSLLEKDAKMYLDRMERYQGSIDVVQVEAEKNILTMDDLYRVKEGMEKQFYDAFVLYAEEDIEFVEEMIDVLENRHRLKLCLKERDLMGGIPFEHEAVMQLISERCNRLIVVVSPHFLKSSANAFFLNFAQAVGIGTGQRKIIPCLYKKCQLPPQLAYQFILDYGKKGLYDFWGRLHACVQAIAEDNSTKSSLLTQQSLARANDEMCESSDTTKLAGSNVACLGLVKKITGTGSLFIVENESIKPTKTKKLISWPRKRREKNRLHAEKDMEPATETISITVSLPSLNNLPSLDSIESTTCNKSTKRRKNLVGTCVNKVQSLLSKQ